MRGKVTRAFRKSFYVGITPAYAGKSSGTEWGFRSDWDHPRLCGEKTVSTCPRLADTGSPPPMRGKASPPHFTGGKNRITPAYAGKSRNTVLCSLLHEDHPRLCGEKRGRLTVGTLGIGSPPPMRGKEFPLFLPRFHLRITPAYAGKSPAGFSRYRDH